MNRENYIKASFGNKYGKMYILDTEETEKGHLYIVTNFTKQELTRYNKYKSLHNFIVYCEDKVKGPNPRLKMISSFTPAPITHQVNNWTETMSVLSRIFHSSSDDDLDRRFKELRVQFRMDGFLPRVFKFEGKVYIVAKTSFKYTRQILEEGESFDLLVNLGMNGKFSNLDLSGKKFKIEDGKTYLLIGRTPVTENSNYKFPLGMAEIYLSTIYEHGKFTTKTIDMCKVINDFQISIPYGDLSVFGGEENFLFYGREMTSNAIIPLKIMSLKQLEEIFTVKDILQEYIIQIENNDMRILQGFKKSIIVLDLENKLHIISLTGQEVMPKMELRLNIDNTMYDTYIDYRNLGKDLVKDPIFSKYKERTLKVEKQFNNDLRRVSGILSIYSDAFMKANKNFPESMLNEYSSLKMLMNLFHNGYDEYAPEVWEYFILTYVTGAYPRYVKLLEYFKNPSSDLEKELGLYGKTEEQIENLYYIYTTIYPVMGLGIVGQIAGLIESKITLRKSTEELGYDNQFSPLDIAMMDSYYNL